MMMNKHLLFTLFVLFLSSCTGLPDTVKPVDQFEVKRYLGKWYEIARLDHSFERGLSQVSAEYSLRDDGGIKVVNRGYLAKEDKWKDAEGKAYFVGEETIGHLKVSFFGPFYGSYAIFELEENYDYAFISGNTTDYLWLLARTPVIDQKIIDKFVRSAKARGFDTDKLIFVE